MAILLRAEFVVSGEEAGSDWNLVVLCNERIVTDEYGGTWRGLLSCLIQCFHIMECQLSNAYTV